MTNKQKTARRERRALARAALATRSSWSDEQHENERLRLEAEIAAFISARSEENRAA